MFASILGITVMCVHANDRPLANPVQPANPVHPVQWIRDGRAFACDKLLSAARRTDVAPGIVLAALDPSRADYRYEWTRDGALFTAGLTHTYRLTHDEGFRSEIRDWMGKRITTLLKTQTAGSVSEPKINPDGTIFTGGWSRPQNDGPALRASAFIAWYLTRALEGADPHELTRLYEKKVPAGSLIKRDLEFTAHQWRNPSYDIWEEVLGDHFFTRLAQWTSLQLGGYLASRTSDFGAADFYLRQASLIRTSLGDFWDSRLERIVATRGRTAGADDKHSGLDAAVLLAVLYCDRIMTPELGGGACAVSLDDERVLSTYAQLAQSFEKAYPRIQGSHGTQHGRGLWWGRYPEDRYDGDTNNSRGNPWILTTLAAGEYLSRLRTRFLSAKAVAITTVNLKFYQWLLDRTQDPQIIDLHPGQNIKAGSPLFASVIDSLQREALAQGSRVADFVRDHQGTWPGSLPEQVDRDRLLPRGPNDLLWSYLGFYQFDDSFDNREASELKK